MSKPDKRLLNKYVFRKKKVYKAKPIYIILFEAILMLTTSLILLSCLNQIPQHFDVDKLFAHATFNLLESITLLTSSLRIFVSIFIVGALVLLSLLLLIGLRNLLKIQYLFQLLDRLSQLLLWVSCHHLEMTLLLQCVL